MIVPEIIYSTVHNKCPRCHKGKIFENNFAYNFKNGVKMNHHCSECQLIYERETGFFYGAMYVSYALMAGILIISFLTDLLFLHLGPLVLASSVVSIMLAVSPYVYRWARTIWINFFVRYDKKYTENKQVAPELKIIELEKNT